MVKCSSGYWWAEAGERRHERCWALPLEAAGRITIQSSLYLSTALDCHNLKRNSSVCKIVQRKKVWGYRKNSWRKAKLEMYDLVPLSKPLATKHSGWRWVTELTSTSSKLNADWSSWLDWCLTNHRILRLWVTCLKYITQHLRPKFCSGISHYPKEKSLLLAWPLGPFCTDLQPPLHFLTHSCFGHFRVCTAKPNSDIRFF